MSPRCWGTVLTSLALTIASSCTTAGSTPAATASPTSSGPPESAYCLAPKDHARAVHFGGLDGQVIGSGPIGVVLTNGSSNTPCEFATLLPRLEAISEFRTLLYFYQAMPDSIAAAAQMLRSQGCHWVLLVGQSLGGAKTLIAAANLKPPPDAAISLSGESTTDDVRNLSIPTLILASEQDHFFPGATARQVFAAIPAVDKQFKVFPGGLHGAELFDGPQGEEALGLVMSFLRAHASPVAVSPTQ